MLNDSQIQDALERYLEERDIDGIESVNDLIPHFSEWILRNVYCNDGKERRQVNGVEQGQIVRAYQRMIGELLGNQGRAAVARYNKANKISSKLSPWYPNKSPFQEKGLPNTLQGPTEEYTTERERNIDPLQDSMNGVDYTGDAGSQPADAGPGDRELHMDSSGVDPVAIAEDLAEQIEEGRLEYTKKYLKEYLLNAYGIDDEIEQEEIVDRLEDII